MGLRGKLSIGIILSLLLLSILSPFVTRYDPDLIDLDSLKQPPSAKHFFGTDNKGRDIFARVLYGAKISIAISLSASLISMVIGLTVGLLSGYFGGVIDGFFMRLVDLFLAFPTMLLTIGITVIFPPGMLSVMIALSAVGWASYARVMRGLILSLRDLPFIEAAVATGCSNVRILFVHILPQCLPFAFAMAGLKIGSYMLTESSLSFLGLGVQPPFATWGNMISSNRTFIYSAPWMVLFPGIMISLTVLSFNLLGDELEEKLGVKRDDFSTIEQD